MAIGDTVEFVCEYCGSTQIMKPSAAAHQRFCSRSCGAKNMWETRARAEKVTEDKSNKCSVDGCKKNTRGNTGLCKRHYMRQYRYGDPLIVKNEAGSCPPDCNCGRHSSKRGMRIPSIPCLSCGAVRMVLPCEGLGGSDERKFCGQSCWREWQNKQAGIRRAAGKTKYWDMSPSEFQERLTSQDNKCAICSKEMVGRDIHRDHDHNTGEWRGLLCNNCNRGLGHFQDDPELLISAAFYLMQGVNLLVNSEGN